MLYGGDTKTAAQPLLDWSDDSKLLSEEVESVICTGTHRSTEEAVKPQ